MALVLATLGGLQAARSAAADPWRVHRGPGGEARRDLVGALLAAPEDQQRAARLRAQLSPAELDRALRLLAERAVRSPAHYPTLMAHGQLLLASGREAEALGPLARAAELRPGRQAPLLATAQAMGRLGRTTEAVRLLEGAAERPGRSRQERARFLVEAAELGETAGDEAGTDRRLRAGLDALLGTTGRADGPLPGALPTLTRLCRLAIRRGNGSACADRLAAYAGAVVPGERRAVLRAEAEVREALGDHQRALAAWQAIIDLGGEQGDRSDGPAARALALMDLLGQSSRIEVAVASLAAQGARHQRALLAAVERAYQRGDRGLGGRLFDQAQRGLSRSPAGLSRLADLASRFNEPARLEACWQAVLALDARDERAIVALGEAHFQGGRRELARETWRRLERVIRPPASAHARLAELFGDHDMLPEAVAEARKAQRLDRDNLSHHRTLARILERKRDNPGAISEWRAVLATPRPATRYTRRGRAAAPGDGEEQALRKEARSRLVALLAREGRERLRAETVLLKDRARRHPDERETALYLAELQLRLAQPGEAVETLTATVEARPRDAEIVLMLVQLLRQSKQTIRALERLERFVRDVPERAAETWMRIAGLRAERYEDQAAMAAVARAVSLGNGDAEILVRGAELAESLGAVEAAATHYRAALALQPGAKAMAGVARLRALRGEAGAAARELMVPAPRSESSERLLPLMFYTGTPEALLATAGAAEERRLDRPLMEALTSAIRALYQRAPEDASAARRLAAIGHNLARPLYDLLFDPTSDAPSALAAVEALGMLGNADAVTSLVRLPGSTDSGPSAERLRVAAAVALGRLGDQRAVPALVGLARTAGPDLRSAVIWALGHLPGASAAETLVGAATDPRPPVAALALLGLGHQRRLPLDLVLQVLDDPAQPALVRRAAVVAAARAGLEGLAPRLTSLLSAPETGLAACAGAALRALEPERSVALWKLALLGDAATRRHATRALGAADAGRSGGAGLGGDDARLLGAGVPDVGAVLDNLCAEPIGGHAYPRPEEAALVGGILGEALAEGGEAAWWALRSLEHLTAPDVTPELRAALPLPPLATRLRGPLRARLADGDLRLRLGAIRVAAQLDGEALSEGHVLAAVVATGPRFRSQIAPIDAESTAIMAARAVRVRGRLHADSLLTAVRPLLADRAWQTRRATVRVLIAAGTMSPEIAARARADGSPFVREAAQPD
jgi:tetratricopeptide (TPR) repeat protein